MWKRFLAAIVGLSLAFAAALFSTVARESGNVWATLVMASIALLLAVFVGLTTVPYLARRVTAERFRDAFEYEVTKAGIVYVLIVIVLGVAALNTGNNLLYIVMAALLAAILVSGVASAMDLRGLRLDVRLPEHVFAGQTAAGRILVSNSRRWLPSFSVSVVSPRSGKVIKRWRWLPGTFSFPPKHWGKKQWLTLPDRQLRRVVENTAVAEIFDGSVYFAYLPGHSQLGTDIELVFNRRGRYQQDGFGLSTRFPFAFLAKTRRVPLAREILVYPPVTPTGEFFAMLPLIAGELENFVRGRGSDLYRIRAYTQEDSARHVDWKASAKSGSLKVREFTSEDERKVRIVFDNPGPGAISAAEYERMICLASSLGWYFAKENAGVSFVTPTSQSPDIHQFLRDLALMEMKKLPSVLESLPVTSDYNIVLTTQPRGTIPTALWARSYLVFLGATAQASGTE